MKQLPKKFVKNCDHVGNTTFVEVKREGNVAMYQRINKDGTTRSYEVFVVKTRLKGQPLPNGTVEAEDREVYPGAKGFGRYAFDCKTLDHAESRFEYLQKNLKDLADARDEAEKTGKTVASVRRSRGAAPKATVVKAKGGKRGRKRMDVNFTLPPSGATFTKKQLMKTVVDIGPSLLYNRIQELVRAGKVVEVGTFREEGQRGKAQVIYRVI